jgi:hypothetical protein
VVRADSAASLRLAGLLGEQLVERALAAGDLGVGGVAGGDPGGDGVLGQAVVGAQRHQRVLLLLAGGQRGVQGLAGLDHLFERHGSSSP